MTTPIVHPRSRWSWTFAEPRLVVAAMVLVICAISAIASTIGADARWLAAVGGYIQTTHRIPTAVPYATAPSVHWADAIVLSQLIFHWLVSGLGDRGLMTAQLVALGVGVAWLARDALGGGAGEVGTAIALGLVAIGGLPSLAITRAQLFSLGLFPATLALLRAERRQPSQRVWLCVPLLALWSNLHGGALVGFGVALLYLVLDRARQDPWTAIGVSVSSVVALCVTPVAWRTIAYYRGVLTNVAAQRGEGLWAPLSLSATFDVVLVVVALLLFASALRGWRLRPAVWEIACVFVLTVISVRASRSGVWLIFFLVGPAARGFSMRHARRSVSISLGAVSLAVLVLAIVRGPLPGGATPGLVRRAIAIAHRTPILAPDIIAEQIALAGGRVWLSNPIDAFSKRAQRTYLDWLRGVDSGRLALLRPVNVVMVNDASAADRLMARVPDFELLGGAGKVRLYVRSTHATPANRNKR